MGPEGSSSLLVGAGWSAPAVHVQPCGNQPSLHASTCPDALQSMYGTTGRCCAGGRGHGAMLSSIIREVPTSTRARPRPHESCANSCTRHVPFRSPVNHSPLNGEPRRSCPMSFCHPLHQAQAPASPGALNPHLPAATCGTLVHRWVNTYTDKPLQHRLCRSAQLYDTATDAEGIQPPRTTRR